MHNASYILTEGKVIYMEHSKRRDNAASVGKNGVLTSLIGGAIGSAVTLAMLLLLPLAVLGLDDPNALAVPTVCVCTAVGSAVGCFFAISKCRESPVRSALISAGVMLLAVTVASLFASGEWSILRALAVVLSVVLGGGAVTAMLTRASKSRKRRMKNAMKRR